MEMPKVLKWIETRNQGGCSASFYQGISFFNIKNTSGRELESMMQSLETSCRGIVLE